MPMLAWSWWWLLVPFSGVALLVLVILVGCGVCGVYMERHHSKDRRGG